MDFYLKAKSETAIWQSLLDAELAVETEEGFAAKDCSVDLIGVIEGSTGFHANLRVIQELTEEQVAVLPTIDAPATPERIWL